MSFGVLIIFHLFLLSWKVSPQLNSQIKIISVAGVRIHRVPRVIQDKRIKEEQIKCFHLMNESINDQQTINETCPISWDFIRCWPTTSSGSLVFAPCPNYIDGFKVDGIASKQCLSTGKWFVRKGISWTNYSGCRPKTDKEKMHYKTIQAIGQIGYAVSIISLVLAAAIFLCFRRLNCERNKMHVSLFVSFLLRAILYYLTLNSYEKKSERYYNFLIEITLMLIICRVIKTAQNYAIIANNTCVFVEAAYLHNILFYHTFTVSGHRLWYYIITAWVLPAIITIIWVIVRIEFDNLFCWDTHDDPYKRDFWVIQVYTITLTLGNVLLFLNLMRSIYSKMIAQPMHELTFRRRIAHSISVLVIVFGVYNLVFIPIDIVTSVATTNRYINTLEVMKLYCEHLISSCQGLLVSILFCFIHREVHSEIRRWLFRRFNYTPNTFRMQSSYLHQRNPKRQLPVTSCSTVNGGILNENLLK